MLPNLSLNQDQQTQENNNQHNQADQKEILLQNDKENQNPNITQKYNSEDNVKIKIKKQLCLNSKIFVVSSQDQSQTQESEENTINQGNQQNTSLKLQEQDLLNTNDSNDQTKQNQVIDSIQTKNNTEFVIQVCNILSGLDQRGTIMIRNIPNRYLQQDMINFIDVKFKGTYDFLYLPMDFKNHCNIGYAFVNFINFQNILPFIEEFNNKRWDLVRSEKICKICYARIQGKQNLVNHFKKSGVMSAQVDNSFQPVILSSIQNNNYQIQQQFF